jgi:D-alanyl-D-alanine-carboxypeptidase/D-alanyl-D-alanine-endopeptidase
VPEGLDRLPRAAAGGVVGRGDAHRPVLWHGDRDGLFQIGSVTKVFTSLLLATYVVEGALRLDQRLDTLLPELGGCPAGAVSLEQLATHTSGLPRLPRGAWRTALAERDDPYARIDHERLVAGLARTRCRPRGRPAYSNLGAGLLGHALARWAGSGYDELVRERICLPLGLDATTCHPHVEPAGHHRNGTQYAATWHFDALAGAGALWSSVADLQRFLAAQLERPAGDLGEAIRMTQQVRVPGRRMDQCLGWMRLHGAQGSEAGGGVLWHNGGTGGYRSFVGLRDAGAVAVLAASDRSVDRIGMRLLAELDQPSEGV